VDCHRGLQVWRGQQCRERAERAAVARYLDELEKAMPKKSLGSILKR